MDTQHIPQAPRGVSVAVNMAYVRRKFGRLAGPIDYHWFYNMVRNKGPWDFKQRNRKYAAFGHFHYGAVGYAGGIPESILLRAAGCAQQAAGTSDETLSIAGGQSLMGMTLMIRHGLKKE